MARSQEWLRGVKFTPMNRLDKLVDYEESDLSRLPKQIYIVRSRVILSRCTRCSTRSVAGQVGCMRHSNRWGLDLLGLTPKGCTPQPSIRMKPQGQSVVLRWLLVKKPLPRAVA